jgi:proteic killer suppression protein
VFANTKMEKLFNSEKDLARKHGQQAKKIRLRMAVLRAAANLARVSSLPPERCHELSEGRAGQFAVDLIQPFRLVFEPADEPVPRKADGGIERALVTKIRILSVEDYH